MKFQILRDNENLLWVTCSGTKSIISMLQAAELIYHHDKFSEEKSDDPNVIKMLESLNGTPLVTLRDDNILEIQDSDFMRQIMYPEELPYYTSDEFAAKHQRCGSIVRRLCVEGRIEGAVQAGKSWLIPKVAEYPVDRRAGRTMPKRNNVK